MLMRQDAAVECVPMCSLCQGEQGATNLAVFVRLHMLMFDRVAPNSAHHP